MGVKQVSTNTGIAVQNYVTAESAYVLVAPAGEAASVEDLKPNYVLDKVSPFGRFCLSPMHAPKHETLAKRI